MLVHQAFSQYGLDSARAVCLAEEMEQWLGRRLSPVMVWDYPTIEALAQHLASEMEPARDGAANDADGPEPTAVIGMGLRFPGAETPSAFWRLLRDGVDAVTEVPPERWDLSAYYDPDPATPQKMCSRWGGFLRQVDQFDSLFFGISPREALVMDPQQRLLLEVTWEAVEDAGMAPERLARSATGVFLGICGSDYSHISAGMGESLSAHAGTGNALSIAANRLSYVLDLRGPSLAVDTACSSSLVAAHLAVRSLRSRECDLAFVGGVNLVLYPDVSVTFSQARMMTPDGRCKTFDAEANGYVRAEGCGVLILKRLSDAIRDHDRLLALVRGTAVNQDGRSNGLTAPNGPSQQAVIRAALADAGVQPSEVSYVEAHGTGTPLGDPIEVEAIAQVFCGGRSKSQPLAIGSVKTNVGHAEGAAGLAGMIKVVLALEHAEIPPHIHLRTLNPHVPWDALPVVVPTTLTPWHPPSGRRLAGVSSFGFGGTNAHVVFESAPVVEPPPAAVERPLHLLSLSAKSEPALRTLAGRFADHLGSIPGLSLADVSFTANSGRSHFAHRLAVVSATADGAREQLTAAHAGQQPASARLGKTPAAARPRVAFLFTGQGSQYVGMGRSLFETQPTFRQELERCNDLLRPFLERPLLDVLYPPPGIGSPLDETAYSQPALFALEYALAQLWRSWGVEPTWVLGHSVGEYVAACVAGVFGLEDGLRLIAAARPPDADPAGRRCDGGRARRRAASGRGPGTLRVRGVDRGRERPRAGRHLRGSRLRTTSAGIAGGCRHSRPGPDSVARVSFAAHGAGARAISPHGPDGAVSDRPRPAGQQPRRQFGN